MERGRVIHFNDDRGYGFIRPDNGGEDVFVHVSSLHSAGVIALSKGQHVEFTSQPGRNGSDKLQVKELRIL